MFDLTLNISLSNACQYMKHSTNHGCHITAVLFVAVRIPVKKSLNTPNSGPITLVIHGGAGTITRANLSPEREKAYLKKLQEALDSGFAVLESGGKSVDAVIAAIKIMENSPLFNAGKGAVFTNDERNELDASIMDGSNLMAGAVAGVTTIKNPIAAAYAVMTKSKHVMLVGTGSRGICRRTGIGDRFTLLFF